MATLALAAAGAAAGSALLPTGLSVLGATLSGATIGSQIGALAGHVIDQALLGGAGGGRVVEGPRLKDLHVTTSSEGAALPRVYGRVRLGGQVIWASDIVEEVVTSTSGGSGKGAGGGGGGAQTTSVEYRYYGNFAVAIAEGETGPIGRVWADGNEIDLGAVTARFYPGSETQQADSLIVAHEGADNAPAYRGTAYIVFERLALAAYGNRIPQLSFEISRPVDTFNRLVRGVVMIPGSGEFALSPEAVTLTDGIGAHAAENVHTRLATSDIAAAVDQLQAELVNVHSVVLPVTWFGSDLRAHVCELRPAVETRDKITAPVTWQAGGVGRDDAHVVSQRDGRPAYGGTPSDASIVGALKMLKARGLSVILNPFVLMDVADGNDLPNPYGGASQPAYPWRGRITVTPAAGQVASADKTSAAAAQVAAFLGTAAAQDFAVDGESVVYSGPQEWSYRRMVLHLAHLAKAAGGVDAFVIGSEMRGLTSVRDGQGQYPFVAGLVALAGDVKGVLGAATKVLYAADWSEYFGHQPADGSGDVRFNLDPLWASANIDAIGIDVYWPLSDWRDGASHADALAGARSIYDLDYLKGNLSAGEGYDWYYRNDAERAAQVRTPISDGHGAPWVFRYKDLKSWWSLAHYDRPGGVPASSPTAWVPQSKPVWIMEVGCPAVDRGANQPNVFVDPKSSESALPYFSRGERDDLMQRRYLQAFIEGFDPGSGAAMAGLNPVSQVYGGRMVDPARIHVYCWDARPYPAFPYDTETWGDGDNWRLGHWLTGRLASAPLAETVGRILDDFGFAAHEAGGLVGSVPGFVVDRLMSAREALQPLQLAYFFDGLESGGRIVFRHRGEAPPVVELHLDDLVETKPEEPLLSVTRAQETELPASAKVIYVAADGDYARAVAEARRLTGRSGRTATAELPLVLEAERAAGLAETWLFEAWSARERANLVLPPSLIAVEPGDAISLSRADGAVSLRVTEIADHGARQVTARGLDRDIYGVAPASPRKSQASGSGPVSVGQPLVAFLDLPVLRDAEDASRISVAATQAPWPGGVAFYSSPEGSGFRLRGVATSPAIMGQTLSALAAGPTGRLDMGTRLEVQVSGALTSVSLAQMLAGGNALAVAVGEEGWEVLQFRVAQLVGPGRYVLSELLRGQAGSDSLMRASVAAGARVVLLDRGVVPISVEAGEIGAPLAWRFGPASRDIGDASFTTQTRAVGGRGLRPLAPVHVRGRRAGGDVVVSWIRRTRVGGDSWEASEVPLGEEREAYEVDILADSGAVVRTLACSAPQATYSAAEMSNDFGATREAVRVRVFQMSAVWGRGSPAEAVV